MNPENEVDESEGPLPATQDAFTRDEPVVGGLNQGVGLSNKGTFVLQKVTKFEGILIQKVFFSNKNIYGNLMLSTCKHVNRGAATNEAAPNNNQGQGSEGLDT